MAQLPRFDTFNPHFKPREFDWTGQHLSRHLIVRGRLESSPSHWSVSCTRCRNTFAITDEQINNQRRPTLCGH